MMKTIQVESINEGRFCTRVDLNFCALTELYCITHYRVLADLFRLLGVLNDLVIFESKIGRLLHEDVSDMVDVVFFNEDEPDALIKSEYHKMVSCQLSSRGVCDIGFQNIYECEEKLNISIDLNSLQEGVAA